MQLEICAHSFKSALAAQQSGAHRIELCSELSLGGITPSHGLIEKVCGELQIPVHVLIRPRSGDFRYHANEIAVMLQDIAFAKAQGAAGIVSGVLDSNFQIDKTQTARLIAASKGLEFTFHRAFDWTPQPLESIKTLLELGVHRLLSSGQQPTALQGLACLKQCLDLAQGHMSIMPGGGVRPVMIQDFVEAGFTDIHASASTSHPGAKHPLPMHDFTYVSAGLQTESDPEIIAQFLEALQ